MNQAAINLVMLKELNWQLFRRECIITTEEMFPPTHQNLTTSRTHFRISKHLPPWLLHRIVMGGPNKEELHHIIITLNRIF